MMRMMMMKKKKIMIMMMMMMMVMMMMLFSYITIMIMTTFISSIKFSQTDLLKLEFTVCTFITFSQSFFESLYTISKNQKSYRHSLSVTPFPIICHFVPLSLCLSVCPAIKAYISVTMSWILMKLGESVGTQVRLIVLKFHCASPLGLCATREARNR